LKDMGVGVSKHTPRENTPLKTHLIAKSYLYDKANKNTTSRK